MFDNLTIYCLATGKPIAAIGDDESGVILDSIQHLPLAEQPLHLDRLALASMRPSLVWLSLTPESLERMRQSNPRQLLAYLMNRLYTHVDLDRKTGKPLNHESWLNARRMRVTMWESIESAELTAERLDAMLYVLLRVDSRYNLTKISAPTTIVGMWDSWAENPDAYVEALWDWHRILDAKEAADQRRAAWQAEFWSEGNRLTRKALVAQFEKVTPPSRAKVERVAKATKMKDSLDFLDQIEREMSAKARMQPESSKPVTPTIAAKPTKPTFKFGQKKDS